MPNIYRKVFAGLAFLCAPLLSAQLVTIGVKGGLTPTPVTENQIETDRAFFGSDNFQEKRYAFGPTVEVKLPWQFRAEVDALYRRVRVDAIAGPGDILYDDNIAQTSDRANVWEFPLLLKRRFGVRSWPFTPFVAAGATLRHVGDLSVDYLQGTTLAGPPFENLHFTGTSGPALRAGITVGGGISIKGGPLRIEPELRYTHWTSLHYLATTEELQFLVGFTFGLK